MFFRGHRKTGVERLKRQAEANREDRRRRSTASRPNRGPNPRAKPDNKWGPTGLECRRCPTDPDSRPATPRFRGGPPTGSARQPATPTAGRPTGSRETVPGPPPAQRRERQNCRRTPGAGRRYLRMDAAADLFMPGPPARAPRSDTVASRPPRPNPPPNNTIREASSLRKSRAAFRNASRAVSRSPTRLANRPRCKWGMANWGSR